MYKILSKNSIQSLKVSKIQSFKVSKFQDTKIPIFQSNKIRDVQDSEIQQIIKRMSERPKHYFPKTIIDFLGVLKVHQIIRKGFPGDSQTPKIMKMNVFGTSIHQIWI